MMLARQQQFCGCRVDRGGRWLSACPRHEDRFLELTRMALENYEKYRQRNEPVQERRR